MGTRALAGLGAGAVVVGFAKIITHAPSDDPFAASFCRSSESAIPFGPATPFWDAHCWGCPVALAGALLIAAALRPAIANRLRRASLA